MGEPPRRPPRDSYDPMRPLQESLPELASVDPSRLAIDDGSSRRTWSELEDRTKAIGNGLVDLAGGAGHHIGLVAGNRVEFLEVALACLRAGLVYTPIKTGWTAGEIETVVSDAESTLLVGDTEDARKAAGLLGVPFLDLDDSFDNWVERQPTSAFTPEAGGWKLSFTSGTTGRPKGVVPTSSGIRPFKESFRSAAEMAKVVGLPGEGTHLFVSRLFHGAPLTFGLGALARGATIRIVRRWNPLETLELLTDEVTSTAMVPTMFRQLLALDNDLKATFDPSSLVTVLHGGEPCPLPVKTAMLDWWGPRFVEYYGFTEGGMTVSTSDEWLERPGTVGRTTRGRILILDDSDQEVAPGVDGWVYFELPQGLSFSYLNEPGQTASAHRGHAFSVGDRGHLDVDGYLFITGRRSDVIIAAGVNIYPAEIESVLSGVDGLLDLAVIGTPDDTTGERVSAVVVVVPGTDLQEVVNRIAQAANQSLAGYKRPRSYLVADSLPRDATGKLLRAQLAEQAADPSWRWRSSITVETTSNAQRSTHT
jgi:acyl-CoA synthetase (AMP-forming)/AMP-acid ligase II